MAARKSKRRVPGGGGSIATKGPDSITRATQFIGAASALINIIKFIVDHWPVQFFGEEPDGAAHRWLNAQLGPRYPTLPTSFTARTVAHKWTDLKRLYERSQQLEASREDTNDEAFARAIAVIDEGVAKWLSETDDTTISDLKSDIEESGDGSRLIQLLESLPPETRRVVSRTLVGPTK